MSEKNIVVVLFVLVLITFSLAQEDSKKMERMYTGSNATTVSNQLVQQPTIKSPVDPISSAIAE